MRAAIIHAAGQTPIYGEFRDPFPSAVDETTVLQVLASALSGFSKSRSSGAHYSSAGVFPSVVGAEGVGCLPDGSRFYFVLPQSPFGALAERTLVRTDHCVAVPDHLSDVEAAALANPGLSAWAALMERAHLQPGETVLVNGATGAAGQLAVKLAKHLGAGRVIATGRNETVLRALSQQGADVTFPLDPTPGGGEPRFETRLSAEVERGIDVVIDYLWGHSALAIITAVARSAQEGRAVRFVQVGEASGEPQVLLPGAALRSSAIELIGSGIKVCRCPDS